MKKLQKRRIIHFWVTWIALTSASGCAVDESNDLGSGGKNLRTMNGCDTKECLEASSDSTNIIAAPINATPCTMPSDCPSGFCADGVCCNSACTGTCQACTAAKKGNGADGTCGSIVVGFDPDDECAAACNGFGACGKTGILLGLGSNCSLGSQCSSGFCVDGGCCASSCTGTCQACSTAKKGSGSNGTCGNIAPNSDPDNECASGDCNGSGACGLPPGTDPNGTTCASGGTCLSGYCADGVCCDTACTGTCTACTSAKKGSGANGVCGNIAAVTDPDNECALGNCNGSGACSVSIGSGLGAFCWVNGDCASGFCVDYVCCNNACTGLCSACSTAKKGSGVDGQCGSIDAGLDPENECNNTTCNGLGACYSVVYSNGAPCSNGGQCVSGSCVDGYCCNTACSGACQACSAAKKGTGSSNGYCGNILGGSDPDNECAGECNGSGACNSGTDPNGTSCTNGATCASGHCIEWVCCDWDCNGQCMSCKASRKGSGLDGVCGTIAAGTDPLGECQADCDGFGACASVSRPNGSLCTYNSDCASNICTESVCCDTPCLGLCKTCTAYNGIGAGTCSDVVTGYDPQNDCTYACDGSGACQISPGISTNGTSCTANTDCSSGLCVDGVCCNAACGSTCDACNVPGSIGTCTSICSSACTGTIGLPGAPLLSTIRNSSKWGVVVADMNGDDRKDIVSESGSYLRLIKRQSDGTFGTPIDLKWPTSGRALAMADLNGDTRPDLVAARQGTGGVTVYLAHWNGTFYSIIDYASGSTGAITMPQPDMVRIADIDGDANLDVAVANTVAETVSLVFGAGNGTFTSKIDIPMPATPTAIAIADMNADGQADLAVATYDAATTNYRVSVRMNVGGTSFGAPVHYPVGKKTLSLAAADFNGDGFPDLVSADYDTSAGHKVRVLLNQGNGTFANAVAYGVAGVGRVIPADMNGDSIMDLVVSGNEARTVAVLIGQGNGTFASAVHYPARGVVHALAVADIDDDNDNDVITGSDTDIAILYNSGTGVLGTAIDSAPSIPLAGRIVRSGDTNGDGILDLVTVGDTSIEVALGQGNGSFAPRITSASVSQGTAWEASLGDLNEDGNVDIMYRRIGTGAAMMSVQLSQGNGSFGPETTYTLSSNPDRLLLRDFNGDGHLDVLTSAFTSNSYTNPSYTVQSIYLILRPGNGNGTFGPTTSQLLSQIQVNYQTNRSVSIADGDFNGDGLIDVILNDFEWHGGYVYKNLGNGTFVQDTGAGPHVQGGLLQYAPDLNGDGKAEHIYGGGGSLTVSYFNGTGTGGTYYQPAVFDFVAVDLNNDGLKDIATVSTLEPIVSVLLQGANGTFGPRLDYVVGQSPRSLTAGDWDNDGKMDLAVQDNASGRVTILRNTCLP